MLFGIIGNIGSGKTTFCNIAMEYKCEVINFADPLKEIGRIFGFSNRCLYGTQRDKQKVYPFWGVSGREFMQKFGTELCRDQLSLIMPQMLDDVTPGRTASDSLNINEYMFDLYVILFMFLSGYFLLQDKFAHCIFVAQMGFLIHTSLRTFAKKIIIKSHKKSNIWVKIAEHKLITSTHENIVVGDVRFEDEAKLIHKLGGKIIRIVRTGNNPLVSHKSEEHNKIAADITIHNNGTLEDFKKEVIGLLTKEISF